MKISNTLIEKYHNQQCSAEERGVVEQWLFSVDEESEELQLPAREDKLLHKQMMWDDIKSVMISPAARQPPDKKRYSALNWKNGIAASLLAGLILFGGYSYYSKRNNPLPLTYLTNSSTVKVKNVTYTTYNVSLGPMTKATINNLTGLIDFTGSLLISPKEDLLITFEGSNEQMMFKMGQTYVVLSGKTVNDRIIIVNERNINDLPPVIQQQLLQHFNI